MSFFGTVRGGTNHSQQTAKHYIYTQSRLAYADDFWREYTLARRRSNARTQQRYSPHLDFLPHSCTVGGHVLDLFSHLLSHLMLTFALHDFCCCCYYYLPFLLHIYDFLMTLAVMLCYICMPATVRCHICTYIQTYECI